MKRKITVVLFAVVFCMLMAVVVSKDLVQAAAPLSPKEKAYYTKILKTKQYVKDTGGAIYGGGSFLLYDINHDGRKELIVGGLLGLRIAEFSIIYSFDGKNFHNTNEIGGMVSGVSSKGIEFTYDDSAEAGAIFYHEVDTYELDKNGNLVLKLQEYQKQVVDMDTFEWKDTEHTYKRYTGILQESIRKKDYNIANRRYSFKTTGSNHSYEEDGKVIEKKYDVQTHTVDEKNIKKYVK